jgi:putative ABC transport system permease protein
MALAGVAFAVMLMLMHLGFRNALFSSAVRFHRVLRADVVLIHPQSRYLVMLRSFPRRRLDQALGAPGVESVSAVYVGFPFWDAGDSASARNILVLGFDPHQPVVDMPGLEAQLGRLERDDQALFDRASRPEYGPIASRLAREGPVECEVNEHRFRIVGLYELGTSFGVDGSMVTSDRGFLRIFEGRPAGLIELGLVRVRSGVDPEGVRDYLRRTLPADVTALTKEEFREREIAYWDGVTPIGYVLPSGCSSASGWGA